MRLRLTEPMSIAGRFIPKGTVLVGGTRIQGERLEIMVNAVEYKGTIQIASDLGKGVIQGVSQYISKRMRTVKITLKAGHRVLLHSPEK